jgi:hypothetical protein
VTEKARDGASLASVSQEAGRCAVCGQELGAERWWVIPGQFPLGEHERCRDWSRYPFPFDRQLGELRKVYRRLGEAAGAAGARVLVETAGRELRDLERRWPRDALVVLDEGRMVIARVKNALTGAGVDPKLTSQL